MSHISDLKGRAREPGSDIIHFFPPVPQKIMAGRPKFEFANLQKNFALNESGCKIGAAYFGRHSNYRPSKC
jgi:hypothetical protein